MDEKKRPYITNSVSRTVQNYGEKVTFLSFKRGNRPNRPHWIRPDIRYKRQSWDFCEEFTV